MKMSEARKRAKKQEEQAEQVAADFEVKSEAKTEPEPKAESRTAAEPQARPEVKPEVEAAKKPDKAPVPEALAPAEPPVMRGPEIRTPKSAFRNRMRRKYTQPDLRVVVFRMAGHEYVVDVAQVQEIIRPTDLMEIDGVPDYIEGLIKRRGRIVPIVDLRKRLGRKASPPTPETCVLIAKLPVGPVGFLVDSASELMWVKTQEFEVPSKVIAGIDQAYVQGVAHLGNRVLVMLDLELLLTPGEQEELSELT